MNWLYLVLFILSYWVVDSIIKVIVDIRNQPSNISPKFDVLIIDRMGDIQVVASNINKQEASKLIDDMNASGNFYEYGIRTVFHPYKTNTKR